MLKRKISIEEARRKYRDWAEFIAQVGEGDELWEWRTPWFLWLVLCGHTGLAIIRKGRVVQTVLA